MLDGKYHAMEILKYVLGENNEGKNIEIIKKSISKAKRQGFRMDEAIFYRELFKEGEAKKFIEFHRITSVEELILKHYEWKMKYEWGFYKNISAEVDLNADDSDESSFLD